MAPALRAHHPSRLTPSNRLKAAAPPKARTAKADLAMKAKTMRTALGCAVAMLCLATATRAEPYYHHRRSSAHGNSPAYWGVGRRPRSNRDCCGWRWMERNPGEASVRQVDPRLRARSDGGLLEEVGTPPPQPEVIVIWPDGSYAGPVIPPWGFKWYGAKQGHRPMRPPASAASRVLGAPGSPKRAR